MEKVNPPIKKESIKNEKVITLKINRNLITTIALVVLVVISIAQAVQLNTLKNRISAGEVQAATTSSAQDSSSTNLQNLPDMVGGC